MVFKNKTKFKMKLKPREHLVYQLIELDNILILNFKILIKKNTVIILI